MVRSTAIIIALLRILGNMIRLVSHKKVNYQKVRSTVIIVATKDY